MAHSEMSRLSFISTRCDSIAQGASAQASVWLMYGNGQHWNEMTVRLREDQILRSEMLEPPSNRDTSLWAYSAGRLLLAACKDDPCIPNGPTPADVTERYRDRITARASVLDGERVEHR